MTLGERNRIFSELHGLEMEILATKGLDYAGSEDALNNFKSNADYAGVTKYQVWLIYAGKHLGAIQNAIKANPELPSRNAESLDESIKDARNYLGLLFCLLHEDLGRKSPEHVHDWGISLKMGVSTGVCYCGVKRDESV